MKRRNFLLLIISLALVSSSAFAKGPTKALFFFDAEDFVSNRSHDAIRDLAEILRSEGVRGQFALSGYLCKKLVDRRRFDVLDALKHHLVGSQTLYHSVHPNLTESTDLADFDEAFHVALAQESESLGMIKAATGHEKIWCSVFPGNGQSYVGLYADAELGIPFFGGCRAVYEHDGMKSGDLWYCNQRHLPYGAAVQVEGLFDVSDAECEMRIDRGLDAGAEYGTVVFYMHPCTAVKTQFWDTVNFKHANLHAWGQWEESAARDHLETERFYLRYRQLVRQVKRDPRYVITDCERLKRSEKSRRTITREEIPAVRAALLKELRTIRTPASWCVADCFQAAVRLLRGENEYRPGMVRGFLERPEGVSRPVVVTQRQLVSAARAMDLSGFLPSRICVGDAVLGPADFLYAALEVLDTGADQVLVSPRDQLGDIGKDLPKLVDFRQNEGWIYLPTFEDRHLSDRLRWQFWTFRYE